MFYDSNNYPFLAPIRERYLDILSEYKGVEQYKRCWGGDHKSWDMVILRMLDNVYHTKDKCPLTATLCESVPNLFSYGFGIVGPGGRVLPHSDPHIKDIRSHLCLSCEEGKSGVNVNGESRLYKEGEWMLFDEGYEHWAWNDGCIPRVTLMIMFYDKERASQNHERFFMEVTKDFHSE